MAFLKKLHLGVLLELFLDAIMLLTFMAQAFIVGCLIVFGYLPLPSGWGNQLIEQRLPTDIRLSIEQFRLHLNGTIDLVGIELHSSDIQQALLQADAAEIELKWNGFKQLPSVESLVLSGGTIFIPAVYSPDGHHRPILEHIAFRLLPENDHWNVDRFAALHDTIHLRGTFELPPRPSKEAAASRLTELDPFIRTFYTQVSKLSQLKEQIDYFYKPTITFKLTSVDAHTQLADLSVSSHRLRHPEAHAVKVQLKTSLEIQGDQIRPLTTPRLTAEQLEIPRYELSAQSLSAECPLPDFSSLFSGQWPQLKLAAQSISLKSFELDAPILQIDPQLYPELSILGATRSLNGAIDLNGQINTKTWSGQVRARGSVDLVKLAPQNAHDKLPTINYDSPPYYDLQLDFNDGLVLKHADLKAQVDNLQIDDLTFDHVSAYTSFKDGLYSIEDLYLRRQKQWIDLKLSYDTASHDYRATLIGSAVPYEYNSLLPNWWGKIFKNIDFSQTDYSLGDFIIFGNTHRRTADLYYGHATAHKVSYMGVALDEAELIVRGRGTYCELHDLKAHSAQAWAHGNIAFTSKTGNQPGPASIRLDMEAQLALEDAAKLFPGNIANIIGDFQTTALPHATLKGAIFHSAYPEYAGKSYFDLTAALNQPLTFKDVPLEQLRFDLYGRTEATYLRNVNFDYADGHATGEIDILTPSASDNSLRYRFNLVDADQDRAIDNLPQLNELKDSLETSETSPTPNDHGESARLDLTLHGQGSIDDPLKHTGFGQFEIRNEKLGTIQLLGPLSKLLNNTYFNFTSFNLNTMQGAFSYQNDRVYLDPLRIDGPRTQINAPGTLSLSDQALNMNVHVALFRNAGAPDSKFRKISDLISKPLPSLLQFELTGTLKEQRLRSLYDPRNLIPLF